MPPAATCDLVRQCLLVPLEVNEWLRACEWCHARAASRWTWCHVEVVCPDFAVLRLRVLRDIGCPAADEWMREVHGDLDDVLND